MTKRSRRRRAGAGRPAGSTAAAARHYVTERAAEHCEPVTLVRLHRESVCACMCPDPSGSSANLRDAGDMAAVGWLREVSPEPSRHEPGWLREVSPEPTRTALSRAGAGRGWEVRRAEGGREPCHRSPTVGPPQRRHCSIGAPRRQNAAPDPLELSWLQMLLSAYVSFFPFA